MKFIKRIWTTFSFAVAIVVTVAFVMPVNLTVSPLKGMFHRAAEAGQCGMALRLAPSVALAAPSNTPALSPLSDGEIAGFFCPVIKGAKLVGGFVVILGIIVFGIQQAFPSLLQTVGINMPQNYLFMMVIVGLCLTQAEKVGAMIGGADVACP